MNTKNLSILTGKEVKDSRTVINQGFNDINTESAGCWITTQDVNSISKGIIISIDRDHNSNRWSVTVEVDSKQWVRYCCLSAVKPLLGAQLDVGTPIGYASKNLMRLEYCTSKKTRHPVRVATKQLYKTDPTPIIFGQVNLSTVS